MVSLKVKLFAVFSLLLLFLSISSVVAQSPYDGAITTNIEIGSNGTTTVVDNFGVTYFIQGQPGATGTVTTDFRTANPQPTADIPSGVSLTHFVVMTFNIDVHSFTLAQVTIPFSDRDVQGVEPPYTIFKYNLSTNSYVELPSTTDTNAQTFTVVVSRIGDSLFAMGGTAASGTTSGFSAAAWAALASSIIIIVLLVVVVVWHFKKRPK
jgi:hypothetical protein